MGPEAEKFGTPWLRRFKLQHAWVWGLCASNLYINLVREDSIFYTHAHTPYFRSKAENVVCLRPLGKFKTGAIQTLGFIAPPLTTPMLKEHRVLNQMQLTFSLSVPTPRHHMMTQRLPRPFFCASFNAALMSHPTCIKFSCPPDDPERHQANHL